MDNKPMNHIALNDRVEFPTTKEKGRIVEIFMVTEQREFPLRSVSILELQRNSDIYAKIEWDDAVFETGIYTYGSDFVLAPQ